MKPKYFRIVVLLGSITAFCARADDSFEMLNTLRQDGLIGNDASTVFTESAGSSNTQNPKNSATATSSKPINKTVKNTDTKKSSAGGNSNAKSRQATQPAASSSAVEKDKIVAEQRIIHLDKLLKQQTAEASMLNQQLQSAQDAAKSAEAKNATLTAQLATLQKQQGASSSELKSQLLKSQEEAKLAASARTELESQLDSLKKQQVVEITALQKQLSEAQAATQLAIKDKTELAARNTAQDNKQSTDSAELTKQLSAAQAQVKSYEASQKEAEETLASLQKKLKDAETSLASAKKAKASVDSVTVNGNSSAEAREAYTLGYYFAASVEKSGVIAPMNRNVLGTPEFLQGTVDRLKGRQQLDQSQMGKVLSSINNSIKNRIESEGKKNGRVTQEVLANALKIDGAKKTKKGAIYVIESKGNGPKITQKSSIKALLTETLSNGQVISRDESINNFVYEMPKEMQEVLVQLSTDGSATLYVPPELAYGKEGIIGSIPPNVASIINIKIVATKG